MKKKVFALFAFALIVPFFNVYADSLVNLHDELRIRLEKEPNLGRHDLSIESRGGVITLEGEVASESAKEKILKIAGEMNGVKEVRNSITIYPEEVLRSSELESQIREKLSEEKSLNPYKLNVIVKEKNAVITGEVASVGDAKKIEQITSEIPGVERVSNEVKIMSGPSDALILQKIRDSINSNQNTELKDIEISVFQGVVSFSGKVESHRDIDRILSITLMIPGVRDIKSTVNIQR